MQRRNWLRPWGVTFALAALLIPTSVGADDDCEAHEAYAEYLEELRDDPCDEDVQEAWWEYQQELAECGCFRCRPVAFSQPVITVQQPIACCVPQPVACVPQPAVCQPASCCAPAFISEPAREFDRRPLEMVPPPPDERPFEARRPRSSGRSL